MKKTTAKKTKPVKAVKAKYKAPKIKVKETTGKFYEFNQNNSGGEFVVDGKICHRLFIEANTPEEATAKAVSMGVYFNGVADGRDCDCCGDRWYDCPTAYSFPHDYGRFSTKLHDLSKEKMQKFYNGKVVSIGKSTTEYKVTFPTVKDFAQYCADQYGWTTPDGRIFYMNGAVVEVNKIKSHSRY
jgi:hypothetical protein